MSTPVHTPKRCMVFDCVLLPLPHAEWLKEAIMFPVSRTEKMKHQRDDSGLELQRPLKMQRIIGARVESPVEADKCENYAPFANDSLREDNEANYRPPPPVKIKARKSPAHSQHRRRKMKTKVIDTAMKSPVELRAAARRAQERVCHQCRSTTSIARRVPCGRKSCTSAYCVRCLQLRYNYIDASLTGPPAGACPSCRGICNCSVCLTKRGLEGHMPHLRALVKDAGKGAVCPRVWLEREGILVERAGGRWVVDDHDAEAYKERLRKGQVEMMDDVNSGRRRWYVGLPPPQRPVLDILAVSSTIDNDNDEGERVSLSDGPYTPEAPAPVAVPIPVPEEPNSRVTPGEQDQDNDSLIDGSSTLDDLDLDIDSREDALRVETELALVLDDGDDAASKDPDHAAVVVQEGIIGTWDREVQTSGRRLRLVRKPRVSLVEELSRFLGDMSNLSTRGSLRTPTSSLNTPSSAPFSKSDSAALKASSSSRAVVTLSSSTTVARPPRHTAPSFPHLQQSEDGEEEEEEEEEEDEDEDEADEHADYDCSHLRRPFVSCNPPRIVGLPLRWSATALTTNRSSNPVQQRSRAYEEQEKDDDGDFEPGSSASIFRDRSSDGDEKFAASAFSVPRRGAGSGLRRRGGKGGSQTRRLQRREDGSSNISSAETSHPLLVDPCNHRDASSYSYSCPPDSTSAAVEPVFVPDEIVDESIRGSKADDVFLLPADFIWDDEEGVDERVDIEAVADAWKSLDAIGIGI